MDSTSVRRIHNRHGQRIGGCNVHFTGIDAKPDRIAIGNVVAVLGGSQHGIDRNGFKVRMIFGGDGPLDVVVEAARASQVHQRALVLVAIHQALGDGAADLAKLDGRAQVGHGVTHIHGETRLVDAHTGLVQRHARALALGHAGTHDGIRAHGLHKVELHLVALAARQVNGTHDGHIVGGLLAQRGSCRALALGHGAHHLVELELRCMDCEQSCSLYELRIGRACAYTGLGHIKSSCYGTRALSSRDGPGNGLWRA
jgi:hypothetical protein